MVAAMRPRVVVPVKDADPSPVVAEAEYDPAADLELMTKVAAADPEAQRELVMRVIGQVRARARAVSHADADDATQIAIIELLRAAKNFRGEGKLEAWCERVAVRTILRHQRRRTRSLGPLVDVDPDQLQHPRAHLDETQALYVWRYLDELCADRRRVLELRAVGFSIEEIAAQTDTSPNTVKDRLRMARAQLRQSMRQRETIASFKRKQGGR